MNQWHSKMHNKMPLDKALSLVTYWNIISWLSYQHIPFNLTPNTSRLLVGWLLREKTKYRIKIYLKREPPPQVAPWRECARNSSGMVCPLVEVLHDNLAPASSLCLPSSAPQFCCLWPMDNLASPPWALHTSPGQLHFSTFHSPLTHSNTSDIELQLYLFVCFICRLRCLHAMQLHVCSYRWD